MDDWELLHGSDTESTDSNSITSNKVSASSSLIDDGMILSDHFSADNLINKPTDLSQYDVIESGDDSSRVDYGSEVVVDQLSVNQSDDGFVRSELGICDSKIGTFGDVEVRLSDFEPANEKVVAEELDVNQSSDGFVRNELGIYDSKTGAFGDAEVRLSEFEPTNEKAVAELAGGSKCSSEADDLEVGNGSNGESQSGVEEPIEDLSKSCSDSGGNEIVSGDPEVVNGEEENEGSERNTVEVVAANSGDESKSRETVTVWWKMPFVLLKYSVFRIGPVWSVSMAAAVMGLVLLGRRLYNMKKKAQRFHLKVAIDDKKVSRVMSQAARLNEAFTEVRRVPVIRPALPSTVTWPVLSLR